jgi:hypothetical protein
MKFVYLMRKIGLMTGVAFATLMFMSNMVFAVEAGSTVLPQFSDGPLSLTDCRLVMTHVEGHGTDVRGDFKARFDPPLTVSGLPPLAENDVLACGIKTGHIKLWMIPYYFRYMIEFALGLSGLLAVGGLVYGGYLYMFGGVVEDKEKGKKAILYALGGMVLTLSAWAIVSMVVAIVSA